MLRFIKAPVRHLRPLQQLLRHLGDVRHVHGVLVAVVHEPHLQLPLNFVSVDDLSPVPQAVSRLKVGQDDCPDLRKVKLLLFLGRADGQDEVAEELLCGLLSAECADPIF